MCQKAHPLFCAQSPYFQNINKYDDTLAFQRKLRSHWQKLLLYGYGLYGNKRHMLLNIFNNYGMPFCKLGDILFLKKMSGRNGARSFPSIFPLPESGYLRNSRDVLPIK